MYYVNLSLTNYAFKLPPINALHSLPVYIDRLELSHHYISWKLNKFATAPLCCVTVVVLVGKKRRRSDA